MVRNGETLIITHIGQATIGTGDSSIRLNDFLLVPNIKKDLFVRKLTTDYPLTVEFDGLGFVIKDRITHQRVARGRKRKKGLYNFDENINKRCI